MSVINSSSKNFPFSRAFGKYRKLNLGILRSGNKGMWGYNANEKQSNTGHRSTGITVGRTEHPLFLKYRIKLLGLPTLIMINLLPKLLILEKHT